MDRLCQEDIAVITEAKENLDVYIDHLTNLLKCASDIYDTSCKLGDITSSQDKKINYLEYRIRQLEDENTMLNSAINEKEHLIDEITHELESVKKKAEVLENANTVINNEIKALTKENNELKTYIDSEENKKKRQLNYKIKTALNNIKIF